MGRGIAFLLVLLISPAVYGQTTHTVGDSAGWDSSVDYAAWATGKTFTVGDSLVFTYGPSHAVDEVRSGDYSSCNTANAINSDSSSPTTIALTTAGTRYFVCPRSNHCSQGQKLAVTIVAASSPTPPSGGAAPSPPSADSPAPPTSTTPASPPPPEGSGAAALGGGMVGLSLAVGAVLGVVMG